MISRGRASSKVEARLRSVSDAEVLMLAEALKVSHGLLFPEPEQAAAALRPFKARWCGTDALGDAQR